MIRPFSCQECGHIPSEGPSIGVWYCPACKTPTIIGKTAHTSRKKKKRTKKAPEILAMPATQSEVPASWTPTSFFPGKKGAIKQEMKVQKRQEEPNSSKRESEC